MWCTFQRALAQVEFLGHNLYPQFFTNYLLDNCPCLLGNWATHSWPCLSDWREKSGPRSFSHYSTAAETKYNLHELIARLDHILTLVGSDARVPVTNCENR